MGECGLDCVAEGVDWISVAEGRDKQSTAVNTIMNLWVPDNAVNILTSC
jgi:hypothetical protein